MNYSNPYNNLSAQDQFGHKLVARLSESAAELPHDISERLRAARMQALGQRKVVRFRVPTLATAGGTATLTLGDENTGFWGRIASIVPLVALILGLAALQVIQLDHRAKELAEVDSALLTDDLPPAAYTDPGFTQFLKASREQAK